MIFADSRKRRAILAAAAGLPISVVGQPGDAASGQHRKSRTLVAYFSRSGNTRVVAGIIHRALGTALFEIRPATPYPEDYLQTVEEARQERDSGRERAVADRVSNMGSYDTLFLGFPIWGETTPPVIRTFLSSYDLTGTTLIPFVTHGGYGLGNSQSVLASHAPKARLRSAFVMEADQERRTMNQVNDWLGTIKVDG
jgi:flavodoxin